MLSSLPVEDLLGSRVGTNAGYLPMEGLGSDLMVSQCSHGRCLILLFLAPPRVKKFIDHSTMKFFASPHEGLCRRGGRGREREEEIEGSEAVMEC
jgi:hypothetical protein